MDIKSVIRTIPNWPKHGVMFRDITTLLKDAKAFNYVINEFYERYKNDKIDSVAGIESRGFIIGGALAHKLNVGFIPIRKAGKLPSKTEREEYELEYGSAIVEIHKDAVESGMKILLVDDLIATAGTLAASINLIEKLGGKVVECAVIIELQDLHGRNKIEKKGHKLFSLVKFEGD
ncbi:adenine phosphoribosyltransferase [Candidatus Woesearchaeota archaeon]|nr:adenine phosphoribosyltransferase [Candidatus Woesearchaeota archaeon]